MNSYGRAVLDQGTAKSRLEAVRQWLGPNVAQNRRWGITWLAYWVGLSVISSVIVYRLHWVPNATGTIYDISSGFAPYVKSLIEHNQYIDTESYPGVHRTTMRLPAIPFFHVAIAKLFGRNLVLHLLLKNLAMYGVCAYAIRQFARQRSLSTTAPFAIMAAIFLNPIGFRLLPALGGEEGYYPSILVLVFVMLSAPVSSWSTARLHLLGLLLALLCMQKSTLTVLVLFVLGFVITYAPRKWLAAIPALYVGAALFGWSLWSHHTTNRWTYLVNISAYDGINLFKGNNELVEGLYPDVHLDVLDAVGTTAPPADIRADEWAVSDHFRDRAKSYLFGDGWHTLRFMAFKTAAPFLLPNSPGRVYVNDPTPLSELPEIARRGRTPTTKSRLIAAGLFLYRLAFLATIGWAIRCLWSRRSVQASLLFLLMSAALAGPFIVGFAYANHLCVLYTLAIVYAYGYFRPDVRSAQ